MLASTSNDFTSHWYPDSGASHHVTPDIQKIHHSAPYDGSDQVVGNGQGLTISSTRSSTFSSPFIPNVSLVLDNLLHVPHITKNLVSVSKFARIIMYILSSMLMHALSDVGIDGLYKIPDLHLLLKSKKSSFPVVNSTSNSTCNFPPIVNSISNVSLNTRHILG